MYSTYSKIVKPRKVDFSNVNVDGSVGIFSAGPLQPGFGNTLGNVFRRVMLSSLKGTRFSSVSISGVLHELSVISGVREDVVGICLNLRNVVLKTDLEESTASLEVTGPCVVTAGMITVLTGVEVVNKDLYLFEITGNETVEMSLTILSGIGHIFHDVETKKQSIGVINLDCYFSPVRNVSFSVESTRIDRFTGYDKLIMNVETDGSIRADDALSIASAILRDMLEMFMSFDPKSFLVSDTDSVKRPEAVEYNLNLLRKTSDMELSVRSSNCFDTAGFRYIGDLVSKTESEMLRMSNFGKKSLEEVKSCLIPMGLSFGMDIGEWPPKNMHELLDLLKKQSGDN